MSNTQQIQMLVWNSRLRTCVKNVHRALSKFARLGENRGAVRPWAREGSGGINREQVIKSYSRSNGPKGIFKISYVKKVSHGNFVFIISIICPILEVRLMGY